MTLFKKCHACSAEVPEDVKGACPKCGESKGYAITKVIQESLSVNDFINAEKKAANEITLSLSDRFKQQFQELSKKQQYYILDDIDEFLEAKQEDYLKQAEKKGKEKYEEARKKGETKKLSFTTDVIIGTEEQRKIKELEDALEEQKKKNIELQAIGETENSLFQDTLNELINKTSKIESHTEDIPSMQKATQRLENASVRAEKVTYTSLGITICALIITFLAWIIKFS